MVHILPARRVLLARPPCARRRAAPTAVHPPPCHDGRVHSYEDLVAEADAADVTGWGFGWLDGRATEERPPWGYVGVLTDRLARATSALDLDTGGGEVVAEALDALAAAGRAAPAHLVVSEAWEPNAERARALLGPRGVEVVVPDAAGRLPLPDAAFDLVTSRHPVTPPWAEVARLLRPGGRYVAQHVGPASGFELIEHFLGPLPVERTARDPRTEVADAQAAGLVVDDVRTARTRIELFDVGAVVWLLRRNVWWVPGFTSARHETRLRELDERMRRGEPFVAYSSRHLIEAHRP